MTRPLGKEQRYSINKHPKSEWDSILSLLEAVFCGDDEALIFIKSL